MTGEIFPLIWQVLVQLMTNIFAERLEVYIVSYNGTCCYGHMMSLGPSTIVHPNVVKWLNISKAKTVTDNSKPFGHLSLTSMTSEANRLLSPQSRNWRKRLAPNRVCYRYQSIPEIYSLLPYTHNGKRLCSV